MGLKGVFLTLQIRVSSQLPPLETRSRTCKQEARLYELRFHAKMCVSWEGAGSARGDQVTVARARAPTLTAIWGTGWCSAL